MISSGGLVVAAPVAEKNQRHQADSESERDDHSKNHRKPAGEADFRLSETAPEPRDHQGDGEDRACSERQRNPGADRSRGNSANHLNSAATCRRSSTKRKVS